MQGETEPKATAYWPSWQTRMNGEEQAPDHLADARRPPRGASSAARQMSSDGSA
jgi:hypothetical protein